MYPTLSDPMDCSLPGSSAHGIFQARVLEWGAIAFRPSKGDPGWGPTLQLCVTHLIGQPLYCSSANAGMLGREAMVMAPTPTHDSAVSPCFHDCWAFLHRHFPPQSPTHPLNPSLHSQQQPSPRDCSTIPQFQLPATVPSRRSAFLSGVSMAAAKTV